jgi:hypothetical protein
MIPSINNIRRNRFQVNRLSQLSRKFPGLSIDLDCEMIERELKMLEDREMRTFIKNASVDDIISQAQYISRVMGS